MGFVPLRSCPSWLLATKSLLGPTGRLHSSLVPTVLRYDADGMERYLARQLHVMVRDWVYHFGHKGTVLETGGGTDGHRCIVYVQWGG